MTFLWILEGLRTPLFNQIMQIITYFGQEILTLAVICILYWCIDKRFAYLLGFTYFTAGLSVQTLKITFRVPRPWVLDPKFKPVTSAVDGATGYSFPSGHTQNATCLFIPLSIKANKRWQKVFCILAFALIAFSRMYLGCHTPKDVVASILVSLFFVWLIGHFQTYLLDDSRHRKYIALALILVSCAVAAYALLLSSYGIITSPYAKDCCKAAGAGLGFACGWYLEQSILHFNTATSHHWKQVLKAVIGLLLTLALKELIPVVLGTSSIAKFLEYFILVIWILNIYPYLFTKFLNIKFV